jgi:AcrR family transcriptional regulator
MRENASAPSGRKAQAARNDTAILDAAREVFMRDPESPISAVAQAAGVGISALYRRYASKEELLRHLVGEGLGRYIAAVEDALADEGDPWQAFAEFMRRIVAEDTHSMTLRLAGTFVPTEALNRAGARAGELNARLFARTQAAGAIRADLDVNDLSFLFEQIASVRVKDQQRTRELRRRYLALQLAALRASGDPLPGPPPSWQDNAGRWTPDP